MAKSPSMMHYESAAHGIVRSVNIIAAVCVQFNAENSVFYTFLDTSLNLGHLSSVDTTRTCLLDVKT